MAEAFSHTDSGNNTLSSQNFILVNPGNQISSVKLTDDNYLLWHLQVLSAIRGLGLEIFILETPPIPERVLTTEESTGVINPSYVSWCRPDQLLFPFLLASMTEGIQSQMIGCETSSQIWLRVARLFVSRSKARVMQYKLQLQTLKKGAMNMRDYLNKMKGYIDILAACGHPISEEDQILHILGGVGLEFDSVVVHVTSRVDTLSVAEVGSLLLAHEGRIESFNVALDSTSPTVNAAVLGSYKKNDNSYYRSDSAPRGRGRGRFRLGHLSLHVVKQVLNICNVSIPRNDNLHFCSACVLGKHHQLPFSSSHTVHTEPLELVYSDVWGPAHMPSINGYRYSTSFIRIMLINFVLKPLFLLPTDEILLVCGSSFIICNPTYDSFRVVKAPNLPGHLEGDIFVESLVSLGGERRM